MFGVIDRLLLRPPPHVTRAEGLLELGGTYTMGGLERVLTHLPYPLFAQLRSDSTTFNAVAAASFVSQLTLGAGPSAEQVHGVFASSNYFHVLGTRPALGRFFDATVADEATPADVVVVSYGFWQRELGGDRAVLGKMLRLGRRDYAVIGVAPESLVACSRLASRTGDSGFCRRHCSAASRGPSRRSTVESSSRRSRSPS